MLTLNCIENIITSELTIEEMYNLSEELTLENIQKLVEDDEVYPEDLLKIK